MDQLTVNILGIYKTRWANNWDSVSDNHMVIFAGRGNNEKGVGLILVQYMKECVLGCKQISDKIFVV